MVRHPIESILWSIALPGFGQILNKQYVKGFVFVGLEFLVNMQSNLNDVIILSFQGNIDGAINHTNYQWLMFYPCLYMFAIWDACKHAGGGGTPYSFLPYVAAAYMATVGLIYSNKMELGGIKLGPVWLTMLFCFIGVGLGYGLKKIILKKRKAAE